MPSTIEFVTPTEDHSNSSIRNCEHNIATTDDKSYQRNYDFYSHLPPPPYTTSSASSSSSTVNNAATAAAAYHTDSTINDERMFDTVNLTENPNLDKDSATNEALATLKHVKEYFVRLKDQSLTTIGLNSHEITDTSETTTDDNTDSDNGNKSIITINNFIMSSLHLPKKQHDNTVIDTSINEGLERIGVSLQQLIDEAQASLTKKPIKQQQKIPTQPLTSSQHSNTTTTESVASYSYHYVQKRYLQSQEKISVAMEQLEESIQSMSLPKQTSHSTNNTPDGSETSSVITTVEHYNKRQETSAKDPTAATTAAACVNESLTPRCRSPSKPDGSKDSSKRLKRLLKSNIAGLFLVTTTTILLIILYYYITHRRNKRAKTPFKYDTTTSLTYVSTTTQDINQFSEMDSSSEYVFKYF